MKPLCLWLSTMTVILVVGQLPHCTEAGSAFLSPQESTWSGEEGEEEAALRAYIAYLQLPEVPHFEELGSHRRDSPWKRSRFLPRLGKRSRNFYARLGR